MREGLQKIVAVDDTIAAVSTPFGRSGIGVIRMSGPACRLVAHRFFSAGSKLQHRHATTGRWRNDSGETVDEVVCTLFQAPASYTGEDVLEISAHGNPLILNEILETMRSAGVRPAGPGEFTLRAVSHGKMDLIQAESIRNFIEAQTETQARLARRQAEGGLSRRIAPIKEELVQMIARLEAGIDFAEDDVELPDTHWLGDRLWQVLASIERLQESYAYGRQVADGIRIVIAGRPNVGKSSLFNSLIATDRAIVTEIPGTTRDVLAETVTLDGIPLKFFDTAGIRVTSDPVETIGVRRTMETVTDAEVVLVVLDGSMPLTPEDTELLQRLDGLPLLIALNKSDLGAVSSFNADGAVRQFRVSARTGEGVPELRDGIRVFLASTRGSVVEDSILTTARQNDAVLRSISALQSAVRATASGVPHEMLALDLYASLAALNELTGEVATNDILGRIFATFCIGK